MTENAYDLPSGSTARKETLSGAAAIVIGAAALVLFRNSQLPAFDMLACQTGWLSYRLAAR